MKKDLAAFLKDWYGIRIGWWQKIFVNIEVFQRRRKIWFLENLIARGVAMLEGEKPT